MKKLLLICILFINIIYADDQNITINNDNSKLTKKQKTILLNSTTSLGLITWGILHWNYSFDNHTNKGSEGWFEEDSKEGGADKLGHAYTAYSMSHLFSNFYKDF